MSAHPDQTSLNGKGQRKDTSFVDAFGGYATALASDLNHTGNSSHPQLNGADITDFSARLAAARVWPKEEIEEDTACLTIEQNGKSYVIGTMGNLSTISGRAKAKKTFAVSLVIAAAVASILVINRIKGRLPDNKQTVLLFDTEQSRNHVLKVIKRICRLCDIEDPPNLIVYSLRSYSPSERLAIVDYALHNTPSLGLAVIDGVRDLAVDPVLDSEQASHIMTHLLQWTDRLKIHVMCVLHQNKGNESLRGHIGTELVNKSETVITVSRDSNDKEVSIVAPEYCRDKEFGEFRFSVDETGLPFLIDDIQANSSNMPLGSLRPKKPTIDTMKPDMVQSIIQRAFSLDFEVRYSRLLNNLIEASEFAGVKLAKSRAERFIARAVQQGHINRFTPPNSTYDAYRLPVDESPKSSP